MKTSSPSDIIKKYKTHTMCTRQSITQNIKAVDYIIENNIKGAIVECGVWRGGSIAAILHRLSEYDDTSRQAYLFDTFEGMTKPTSVDIRGKGVNKKIATERYEKGKWCYGPMESVVNVMNMVPYPQENINYVVGDVCETLPYNTGSISILRLDTDFYESTKCELEHLFPLVSPGGVVIFDDYSCWAGCRKAVDDYLPNAKIEQPSMCGAIMYKEKY